MRILIIGSEGFIGSHCVDYFLNKNWEVFGIDLIDSPHCEYFYKKILSPNTDYSILFAEITPQICIFATGSANVALSNLYPLADVEANSLHVFRILDIIRQHSPNSKFINISSAAVYGNPEELPIKENSIIKPISPYGWHKYYSELICSEFYSIFNISCCSLRPFSVYGPRQTKLLFWDIYQKTLKNETVELYGIGSETRDFIYISDFVKVIDIIIEKAEMKAESYNIAFGKPETIETVAKLFLENLNYKGEIKFNNIVKLGDPQNWNADISAILKLGFQPTIKLKEGLQIYSKWLRENA